MDFLASNNIYQNNITNTVRNQENKLVSNSFKNSINAVDTNIIPRNFNQNILNQTNKFKIHEQLQDIREHNQNDKKYIISPLSGEKILAENFSHNNMVPFFGSNARQSTIPEVNHQKLENFTGDRKHYRSKSEVPNMFEPKFNVNNTYGTNVHSDEMFQRYVASFLYRQLHKLFK